MTLEEFLVRAGVVQENPAAVAVVATIRVMAPPQLIQAVMAGVGCLVPHIFAKVLELPFTTDVDISVKEGTAALRFVASVPTPSRPTRASPRSSCGTSLQALARMMVRWDSSSTDGGSASLHAPHHGLHVPRSRGQKRKKERKH
jgi:hypothetical protein